MKIELYKCLFDSNEYKDTHFIEFAFAGRSNSGKSSLINSLFMCNIARVSKTPGKTKTVNLYLVDNMYIISDLPGYGYAKVAGNMINHWQKLVEGYLLKSKRLDTIFILSDIRRGIEDDELMLIDWLKSLKKNYKIIFTKIDKISKNELSILKQKYLLYEPFYFSAITKDGRKEILKYLVERCKIGGKHVY